jgi:hypothetical protein
VSIFYLHISHTKSEKTSENQICKTWAKLIGFENPGESSTLVSGMVRSRALASDTPLGKHATKLVLHYQSIDKEKKPLEIYNCFLAKLHLGLRRLCMFKISPI